MAKKGKTIGIDIRPYLYDKSGIGQYLFQLTKTLIEQDKKNTYVLFADRPFDLGISQEYKKIIFSSRIPKFGTALYHLRTIIEAKKYCDVYLTATSLYVPAFRKDFAFLVIHDLVMFELPEYHTLKTKILSKVFMKLAVKNAKGLIAVSEHTKKDLLRYFPDVDKKKVHVILEGISDTLYPQIEPYDQKYWERIARKYGVKGMYILFVGTIQPRKNLLGLIKAFEQVYKQDRQDIQLVIVGKRGWKNEELDAYLDQLPTKLRKKIIMTGFIPDKDKAYLYKNALTMVYPSFYEGFGIPALEAMRFGLPVIVSNTSSLPEVVGDSALLIDPQKPEEIYTAIHKLLTDTSLYTQLQKKSEERVKQFNWEDIANSLIKLF